MSRCSYAWADPGKVPCPLHPRTGRHECRRSRTHEPRSTTKCHECRCGKQKVQIRKAQATAA